MKILNKYGIDLKFVKFLIVGALNTAFGTAIMFGLYNLFNCSYYVSSFCNYFFGSILSYFLNKYFTFNYKEKSFKVIIRFIINIIICYIISYGLSKPLIEIFLKSFSEKITDNIAMAFGMILFVLLNYFGQRLIVFNEKEK